jgi:hypothetical protein
MLTKVISGGQTGVDIAALRAAKDAGIATGGWIPKGFRTENGFHPEYAEMFGLQETESADYPERTRRNVFEADCTILLTLDRDSPGSKATLRAVLEKGQEPKVMDLHWFPMPKGPVLSMNGIVSTPILKLVEASALSILNYLEGTSGVLNIAGNRERGLEQQVETYLSEVFAEILELQEKEVNHG